MVGGCCTTRRLLAFFGATAHGVMAGTDSPTPWAFWMYAGSSVAVAFLLAYRIAMSVGQAAKSARSDPGITRRESA